MNNQIFTLNSSGLYSVRSNEDKDIVKQKTHPPIQEIACKLLVVAVWH